MDPHLKTVLTYTRAVELGVAEAPLPIMQYEAYRTLMQRLGKTFNTVSADERREWQRLANAASRAKRKLKADDRLPAYYTQRQMLRDMGADPDTVVEPAKQIAEAQAAEDTANKLATAPAAELERMLAALPHWRRHRVGERSADAVAGRRELRDRQIELEMYLTQARVRERKAKRVHDKQMAAAQSQAARLSSRGAHEEALRARAAVRAMQSWGERALEDLLVIERLGRPMPRAARHPRGHVPLHLRAHHPATA